MNHESDSINFGEYECCERVSLKLKFEHIYSEGWCFVNELMHFLLLTNVIKHNEGIKNNKFILIHPHVVLLHGHS